MKSIPIKRLGGLFLAAAVTFALVGCKGDAGPAGVNGTNGTNGTDGTNGTNAVNGINVNALTPDQWIALQPQITVKSVTMGGAPVVNFSLTTKSGVPLVGLAGWTTQTSSTVVPAYRNFAFTMAKLVPGANGSPSKWVSYIVTTVPATGATAKPMAPTSDNQGTLIQNADGTYSYTFYRDITKAAGILATVAANGTDVSALGNVGYDNALPHRLGVEFYGQLRGYGTNSRSANTPAGTVASADANLGNPINVVYDFDPNTGLPKASGREITTVDTCNTCHSKLTYHGGHRLDPRYCVTCHTDQRRFGASGDATMAATSTSGVYQWTGPLDKNGDPITASIQGTSEYDFPAMIHKIHMGEHLSVLGYDLGVDPVSSAPAGTAPTMINDIRYPQDQRNCNTCHTASNVATPQGDDWNTVPSRLACGACHDSIIWADGTNHVGGPMADDSKCSTCHTSDAIKTAHTPVVPPDTTNKWNGGSNAYTNAAYVAANQSNLPAGAHTVAWNLTSVTVTSAGNPQYVFQILIDNKAVPLDNPATSTEILQSLNYVGSPSLELACGMPEAGVPSPADYNFHKEYWLKSVWNGSVPGIITTDASNNITVTLTGVIIPSNATMVTGGIGYSYGYTSQPLTQTDVPPVTFLGATIVDYSYNPATHQGGVSVPALNQYKVATGYTPRRTIVSTDKCNACHKAMGVFEDAAFHAGERNNATSCAFCHNADNVTAHGANEWALNAKEMIHSLHAAPFRNNKYSYQAASASWWNTTYPAILNDCEACHVSGSYDFSNAANAAAIPNMLWSTAAEGVPPATAYSVDMHVDANGNVLPIGAKDAVISAFTDPNNPNHSPYVLPLDGTSSYGLPPTAGVSSSTNTIVMAAPTGWGGLVDSPIASACFGCHDSNTAIAHMQSNGGAIFTPRANVMTANFGAFNQTESCLVCHGAGKVADIKAMHMNF